ncbi:uncharacterized protein BDV14DRAFT_196958 [Aspergillus stella-maris]|uniref:uncharacterized protein n=1 Tax=Aspergillus stella-maris TaxID=1810926 RepID=UPI003CCCEBBF
MPPYQDFRAKQELLEALLKEYRIEFVRSSDDETRANLRAEFEFTEKIEQLTFRNYAQGNNETDPAIVENNVKRARNLMLTVDRCARFEVNEDQWRREVENAVFGVLRRPMIW